MTCQYYNCTEPTRIHVSLGFTPGGSQTLGLCTDHAWEMYLGVVNWFGSGASPAGEQEQDHGKNVWIDHDPREGLKETAPAKMAVAG